MNKILVALIIVLLLAEMGALGVMLVSIKGQQADVEAELDKTTKIADETRSLESEISSKEADLAPIQAKIDFVEEANKSGEQYWDRFHAINEYIYENAQMRRFSLTGPSSVNFTVIVGDTTDAARFVLDLVHCPALSNISVSGLPAGMSIEGIGGTTRGGGFQPMGGPEEMMGEPGMMDEPGMMEPGMGAMGPMGGGSAPQASASGDITLNVTASLVEPVSEPAPSGGAGGGGGAGMGMGMGPGMEPGMGPEGMPPGMGEPGMEEPGMAEPPMDEEMPE